MEARIADGRFTREQVTEIGAEGARIGAMPDTGEGWWNDSRSRREPPADWPPPALPEGWDVA